MQQWLAKLRLNQLDKLAPLVFFVLMVWLCWRLASLLWWFVAPPQTPVIQPVVLGSQQPVMPDIIRFSLFEEQGQNPQAQVQSNVPLKLEGVMVASPRYLSSAVVRIDNQVDRYRIGDKIVETGLEVADVFWDHIVLRNASGQTQELKFGAESTTANLVNNVAENVAIQQNGNQQAINGAIQGLQQDREQYLNQMGVSAGQNGLEITDKTPAAIRSRLGLRSGDRIVSVNGQQITAGINESQLLEQIKTTGQAKIEIQRGDQTMTIQQNF